MTALSGHVFQITLFKVYELTPPEGPFPEVNYEPPALFRCPNRRGRIFRICTFPPALAKQGLWGCFR